MAAVRYEFQIVCENWTEGAHIYFMTTYFYSVLAFRTDGKHIYACCSTRSDTSSLPGSFCSCKRDASKPRWHLSTVSSAHPVINRLGPPAYRQLGAVVASPRRDMTGRHSPGTDHRTRTARLSLYGRRCSRSSTVWGGGR